MTAAPTYTPATRDFRTLLAELSRSGEERLFHPLTAGAYVLSLQASASHASLPRGAPAAAAVEAWEAVVFDRAGRWLTREDAPWLAGDFWGPYFDGRILRGLPTKMVPPLLDLLHWGPEHYFRHVRPL